MSVRNSEPEENQEIPDTNEFHYQKHHALIPPAAFSPLNILTIVSFLMTVGAFIWAMIVKDGGAALALATMSLASILIGIASYWTPLLDRRPTKALVIEGDVVIRTRQGGFVIVKCTEEVARELYTGPEECLYMVGNQWFKVLVGIGTILVMISVVLLGNCNWTMQVVIVVIYTLLNGFYWAVSLLPKQWLWDMSRYNCEDITPVRMKNASKKGPDGIMPSFTRSMWYAILATGTTKWVAVSETAPKTDAWEKWTKLAEENLENEEWDAVAAKNTLMEEFVHTAKFDDDTRKAPTALPTAAKEEV